VELLLNLIWIAISLSAVLVWISNPKELSLRAPQGKLRGLMVVVCILALLFPVISISDDLSQTIGLAEGARLQDMLKAPELRGIYYLAVVLPEVLVPFRSEAFKAILDWRVETSVNLYEILLTPSVEKRPPPISA
jgi:hypothetical protein